jgi:regulator of RNase E activity RraA
MTTGTDSTADSVDATLGRLRRQPLSTAVLGDILDQLGHRHRFLPPGIRPLDPRTVLVGRAMPVLLGSVFAPQSMPFGHLTAALDQLQNGEIYLVPNAGAPCAAWGEIMSVTARARGAAGSVIDGFHRDTRRILGLGFPVFSRGGYAQDAAVRTVVIDYRVPIEIGSTRVEPGDLLVGDVDGVVVIPRGCEAEVIERASLKAAAERDVRVAIENGLSSTDAFARHGVL